MSFDKVTSYILKNGGGGEEEGKRKKEEEKKKKEEEVVKTFLKQHHLKGLVWFVKGVQANVPLKQENTSSLGLYNEIAACMS